MRELRNKVEGYFSGPGFWPFFLMMVLLFLPFALIFPVLGWTW